MKYILKIIVPLSLIIVCFSAKDAWAETKIDTLIIPANETQTWESVGNPYIVDETVYIHSGGKLIIKEGVVVKFKENANIYVEGILQIKGRNGNSEKVRMTSYNDKEFYPEFSGPNEPQPADWEGIIFGPFSEGYIYELVITYGDAMGPPDPEPEPIPGDDYNPEHSGVISVDKGAYALIQRSVITKNYGGISNNRGTVDVSNSEIYGNLEYGVWNYNSHLTDPPNKIQAINNWWGYNSGPKHQTLNPNGEGNRVHSTVIFDPWQLRNPPVIIIPGILGSWQNSKGEWQLDPIIHTYDNLVNGFKSQDYKEGENLFPFPYNWRNSNVETAKLLKEKINEAKQLGKSPRVDIVAHSMGGLVARQYIESDDYQNDVFHLVTLGTPHNGSPNAYLMWEGGIISDEEILGNFKDRLIESFKKLYFIFEAKQNGYSALYKYIREKVPSGQELLPVYDYLRNAETKERRIYPDNYPRNEFLENLNSEENLSSKFFKRPNLSIINLAGVEKENKTVDIIRVINLPEKFKDPENLLWPHGYPEGLDKSFGDHGLELGEGDGTVPLKSVMIDGYPATFPYTHHEMATETFDKVFYYLNNTNPIKPGPIRRPPPKRLLFFRLHSPVDFQIIDPQGNKIGKDFSSNTDINQISDAFYSGFNTDTEFITIPDPIDGEYKIITQGTDNGSFELTISSIDEEKTDEQSYQSTTQPNQEDNLKVEYSQNKEHPLKPITSTNKEYTIDDLTVKLKDYYKNNSIKDRYIYHYFKHLLRGVEIGVKRISQVQEEIEEINQRLQEPNLKPHKKEVLEYRKWLYQQRIIFHQTIIKRNLTTFINKINQYQPDLIEPEAAQDLTRMAQIILARYE